MARSDHPENSPERRFRNNEITPHLATHPVFSGGEPLRRQAGSVVPLFGRDGEQARLRGMLDDACNGNGGIVLISGEAGVGKTTLAASVQIEACSRGISVKVGHCYELAATPPYGPWVDSGLFERRAEWVPQPPALGGSGGESSVRSQAELFEQVQGSLAAISDHTPLVLVLEDLHWADPASVELLRFISRRLDGLRILLVVTYRDDEVTWRCSLYRLLPVLVRESRARRIGLRRLGESTIQEIVDSRYGLREADRVRLASYLASLAGGNPFFTVELLRALQEEGYLRPDEEGWSLEDLSHARTPPLLRQVIDGRLTRLDEGTRILLSVAAVIGQEVSFDLWRSVSQTEDERLATVVEQAIEANLMEQTADGEGLRFVHALIREELYGALLLPRQRSWHRRIGEALAGMPRHDPDAVAYHFRQAADERATGWLIRAGKRAERSHAWVTAAERFEAALGCLGGAGEQDRRRGWLLFRIGVLLRYSDTARSISYLEEAERAATVAGDRALAVNSEFTHGFIRCMSGKGMRRGLAEMEASIAASEEITGTELESPDELTAGSSADTSLINEQVMFGASETPDTLRSADFGRNTFVEWLAHVGRYEEAVEAGAYHLARVDAVEPGAPVKYALCNNTYFGLAVANAGLGRPKESRRWFEIAHRAYRAGEHHIMDSMALVNELLLVMLPYYPDRVAERGRIAEEEIRLQRKGAGALSGDVSWLGIGAHRLQLLEGQWQEAGRLMQPERGPSEVGVLRQYAFCSFGELARNRGEPERAWEYVREVLPLGLATEPGDNRFFSALTTQRLAANLLLDTHDLSEARAWLAAHDRWLQWSGAWLWRAEGALLWARYHQESGSPELAREAAEEALALASRPRQPLVLLAAHRFLGELDIESGDFVNAQEHTEESLSLGQRCALPYERALTLLTKARLVTARDGSEEATPILAEVREICSSLGAGLALGLAAELEKKLRSSPSSAPSGLTGRELEILRLVAQGMSNQEIAYSLTLSKHTIHRHVANVFSKLEVSSRAAAAALAGRQDLL